MMMKLRRIAPDDPEKGFRHVVSRFSDERDGVDLGREWEVLEQILLAQGPEEIAELPITMGDLLGDDGLGTACFYLPPHEVAISARFLASVDLEQAVADRADGIAATFRDGTVPRGYPESLVRHLRRIRDLYVAAERAGEGVAKLAEA